MGAESQQREGERARLVSSSPPRLGPGRLLLWVTCGAATVWVLLLLVRWLPRHFTPPASCSSAWCRRITEVMDLETDPCQDFYQYSCGNWAARHPRPSPRTQHWTNFVVLDRKNTATLRRVLEGKGRHKYKLGGLMKRVRKHYNLCLDRDTSTLQDTRNQITGLIEDLNLNITSSQPSESLALALATLYTEFGVAALFKWGVGINELRSGEHAVRLGQPPGFTLPLSYYGGEQGSRERLQVDYMKEVQELLIGQEVGQAEEEQLLEVVRLEGELSQALLGPAEERAGGRKQVGRAALQREVPAIDWGVFMEETVEGEVEVVLTSPSYLRRMSDLLLPLLEQPKGRALIQRYLVWRALESLVPRLPRAWRQARETLRETLQGRQGRTLPKMSARACVKEVGSVYKNVLGHIYIRETEREGVNTSKKVREIFSRVKASLESVLASSQWMDAATRARAVEKSLHIQGLIGYSEAILDVGRLVKSYKHTPLDESSYLVTSMLLLQRQHLPSRLSSRLSKPVASSSWATPPETINAFYTAVMNSVLLPLGILQPPFYDAHRPDVLNYGGIGFSIGHELTHAFDDHGRRYDASGKLEDWWSAATLAQFTERAACLVSQYGNLTLGQGRVDGRNTLGENIADNGGLKAAYDSYFTGEGLKAEVPRGGRELGLTAEQLFFVGYTQVWCNSNTEQYEQTKMATNAHPPSVLRVQAVLANSPHFSRAFSCPVREPAARCGVW